MEEPGFVGESRHGLVDGLVALFDEVSQSEEPLWVSFEAPPGWGRTRVVHEFYRRLAGRQGDSGYWPPAMLTEFDQTTLMSRRKRSFPLFPDEPRWTKPEFVWFGINAHRMPDGSRAPALHELADQLTKHLPHLKDRWREIAPKSTRFAEFFKNTALPNAAVQTTISMFVPVPGLGFWQLAAKEIKKEANEQRERKTRENFGRRLESDEENEEFIAGLAEQLTRIALPGLPMVLFVQDLDEADELTIELLARILASKKCSILIVSSARPGRLEQPPLLPLLTDRVDEVRRIRVRHDEGTCDRLPEGANLLALTVAERQELVRSCMPTADESTTELIANHFSTPLTIEIFCGRRKYRTSRERGQAIQLTEADLKTISDDLREVLKLAWKDLPNEQVQRLIALSALGAPISISDEGSDGDDRWHHDIIARAARTSGLLDDEVSSTEIIGMQGVVYGWAQAADEWLQRFIETDQRTIALEYANEELNDDEIREFRTVLAEHALVLSGDLPEDQRRHRSRLLLALHHEGFISDDMSVADAAVGLLESGDYLPPDERQRLPDLALSLTADDETSAIHLKARFHEATALGEKGLVTDAVEQLRDIADTQTEILGRDAPDTLSTRGALAFWLGEAGRVDEAIGMLEEILDDENGVLGEGHPDTFATRHNIASFRGESGRIDQALEEFDSLLNDELKIFGPDHPSTLITRSNIAELHGESGRFSDAIERLDEVLNDEIRILGPDHPSTLRTRNNRARWLGESGQIDQALEEFTSLLEDNERILGLNHPDTFNARHNIAYWTAGSGRVDAGIDLLKHLLEDQKKILAGGHPDNLKVRHNIAYWLAESGRLDEAITEGESLVSDQEGILDRDNPDLLLTRRLLSEWRRKAGDS